MLFLVVSVVYILHSGYHFCWSCHWYDTIEPTCISRTISTHRTAGGHAYPLAITCFITGHAFPAGIRLLSAIIGGGSTICFLFGASNAAAKKRPLNRIFNTSTWIDIRAFKNPLFLTYSVGVGFVFLAFYPLLFHVIEWAERERFKGMKIMWFLTIVNGYVIYTSPTNLLFR